MEAARRTTRRTTAGRNSTATSRPSEPRCRTRETTLNPDRLPTDGLFLTGQTLRVIQEPPPVGSPKTAPARQYLKAWEKAYAWSNDKVIQADVITYDSYKDLVYAYGEEGHNVIFAEQHAAGQPTSPGSAKAVQLNPKTGGIHLIDSNTIGMIDKNTGYRPIGGTARSILMPRRRSRSRNHSSYRQ